MKAANLTGSFLIGATLCLAGTALAQTAPKAGYTETAALEGPGGVLSELAQDDATSAGLLSPGGTLALFDPWYAWKKRLNQDLGLQLGFSFQTLSQWTDETLTGIDEAAATRGQLQGSWTLE